MRKKEKSSLEKSHSASSNFLLTLLCILCAVFFAALFAVLVLKDEFPSFAVFLTVTIFCGACLTLCLFFLSRFKR